MTISQSTEELRGGMTQKLRSCFSDLLMNQPDIGSKLSAIVDNFKDNIVVSPTTDGQVKNIVEENFYSIVAAYKAAKQARKVYKQENNVIEGDRRLVELQNKVDKLAGDIKKLQLLIRASMVVVFDEDPRSAALKMNSTDDLLAQYRGNELFANLSSSGSRSDVEDLLNFRNYVSMALTLIPHYRNEGTIMRVAARLEGRKEEYITGSGASVETRQRQAIYRKEKESFEARERSILYPNTRRHSLRSYADLMKVVILLKRAAAKNCKASSSSSKVTAVKSAKTSATGRLRNAVNTIRFIQRMKAEADTTTRHLLDTIPDLIEDDDSHIQLGEDCWLGNIPPELLEHVESLCDDDSIMDIWSDGDKLCSTKNSHSKLSS